MYTILNFPINIWDDFYDDGYVPEGEVTESYIYVEDTKIPHNVRKEVLEILFKYINENLNTEGIKLWMNFYDSRKKYPALVGPEHNWLHFERWEIRLEGITHERLDEWMEVLKNADIKMNNIPLRIYSES